MYWDFFFRRNYFLSRTVFRRTLNYCNTTLNASTYLYMLCGTVNGNTFRPNHTRSPDKYRPNIITTTTVLLHRNSDDGFSSLTDTTLIRFFASSSRSADRDDCTNVMIFPDPRPLQQIYMTRTTVVDCIASTSYSLRLRLFIDAVNFYGNRLYAEKKNVLALW